MGTSAIIAVEGSDITLYKHFDGYKEGTLPWLQDFNEKFVANRGNDIPYKIAQLIRSSFADADEYDLDKSRFTGWGVHHRGTDPYLYANFEYTLKKDGSVSIRNLNS